MKTKISVLLIGLLVLSLLIVGCGKQSAEEITGGVVADEPVVAEEPVVEVVEESVVEVVEEPVKELEEEVASGPKTHTVSMTGSGFVPGELFVAVGDTVEWTNARGAGPLAKAMAIGVRQCRYVKSKVMSGGETYSYTFDKVDECTIVDGILTTAMPMKVFIE